MRLKLLNCLSSITLLIFTYLFYYSIPYYQQYYSASLRLFSFRVSDWLFLGLAFVFYGIALISYYLIEKKPEKSKSVYCLQAIFKLAKSIPFKNTKILSHNEKLGLLTFLLKAFFAPLMVIWLADHALKMLSNGYHVFNQINLIAEDFVSIFNTHGFWFLLQVIMFFDVFFFTLGYLIEIPRLNNRIRSVDPTLFGWLVALVCYPPFNILSSRILGWEPDEFPQFENVELHLIVNFLLLSLMAVYTWASIALNFKASNLTHRGIISSGPYQFIRHPAYTCKNISWWLAALPSLITHFNTSDWWQMLLTVASIAGWTLIYTLRALTEEDHLKSVDDEYDLYCQKVKYRFVPGLY